MAEMIPLIIVTLVLAVIASVMTWKDMNGKDK